MTLVNGEYSDNEEPDLPEKFTKAELASWASLKHKRTSASTGQKEVSSDDYGLLHDSEQHQQGLAVSMKRLRRDIIYKPPRPDLNLVTNSKMPEYLQDVQRYNPELMNHATTEEHCTLPTRAIIDDEKRVLEAESKKVWHLGLVLKESSNLVDPKWKREQEETFISKIQKKTRERSAHVLLGVLQQWQHSHERSAIGKVQQTVPLPIMSSANSVEKSPSAETENTSSKTDQNEQQSGEIGKKTLETVIETDETEEGALRHSSR